MRTRSAMRASKHIDPPRFPLSVNKISHCPEYFAWLVVANAKGFFSEGAKRKIWS